MQIQLDPARLDDFEKRLQGFSRTRVDAKSLWSMFAASFPGRPQGAEERRWFLACLHEMEHRGLIKFPPVKGKRWDKALGIAVPVSVDLIRKKPPAPVREWRQYPWHPNLQWIADMRQVSDKQFSLLKRVHEGLVSGAFDKPAPLKYRSLQLSGSEKGLGKLLNTQLFKPGRLSLDVIGCLPDIEPLVWESISENPDMIVFENAGPFLVALEVLRDMDKPPYGMISYGGGKRFKSSIRYLLSIGRPIEGIYYVGDLDAPGLEIALAAKEAAKQAGGLPELSAAPGLHQAMLEAAKEFGHPGGWPYQGSDKGGEKPVNAQYLSFLPEDVRANVADIINRGHRIPEEVLGPTEMYQVWRVL